MISNKLAWYIIKIQTLISGYLMPKNLLLSVDLNRYIMYNINYLSVLFYRFNLFDSAIRAKINCGGEPAVDNSDSNPKGPNLIKTGAGSKRNP